MQNTKNIIVGSGHGLLRFCSNICMEKLRKTSLGYKLARKMQEMAMVCFNTLQTGNLNHPGDKHF
jgi:hypothetical protein